ncbi:MAG TPA: triple tyrosine motif-containing protein, partial [Puia sp.]|nr:triple tyrosine motif-containing protein [Puia sp.]
MVRETTQDKYGFIWFATEHSLIKHDGSTFKIYRHDDKDSLSIPESRSYDLYCGANGLLLLVCDKGICYYDYDGDRFTRLVSSDSFKTTLVGIPFLHDHEIWFAAADRALRCFDLITGKTRTFAACSSYIATIFVDSRRNTWIGTHEGLYLFDPKKNRYERWWKDSLHSTYGASMVTSIIEDEENEIWFTGYNSGIYKMNLETRRAAFFDFQPFHWKPFHFYALDHLLSCSINGRPSIVACSVDGLVILDRSAGNISLVRHDPSDPSSLTSNELFNIFKDNTGEIWIATADGISEAERVLANFRTIPLAWLSRPNAIRAIWPVLRNKVIWIGTDSMGLLKYDLLGNRAIQRIPVMNRHSRLLAINELYMDKAGRLWLGTNEGVGIADTATGKITWPAREQPRGDHAVRDLFAESEVSSNFIEDGQGNIWVGTANGISIYSRGLQFVKNLKEEKNAQGTLQGTHIFALYPKNDHQVWVTTKTVNLYDLKTNSFVELPKQGVPAFTDDITGDGKDNFYFATQSRVYQYKQSTNSFYLPYFNLFLEPTLTKAFTDGGGRLWVVAFGSGLLRINTADTSLQRFTKRNGLLSNMVNGAWSQPGGPVFLLAENGLQYFYPDSVERDTTPAPLRISGINILDKPVRAGYQRFADSALSVSYKQNVIRFEFSLLDYSFTDDVTYQFRLDGFDRNWINANGARFATYTNLDAGDYVFRVRAKNHDGFDSGQEAVIRLQVVPPFWRTWWFLTALSLIAVSLLFIWIRSLMQKLRSQKILNRFATSLYGQNTIEDTFLDVARDCVNLLGSVECSIYTTDEKKKVRITHKDERHPLNGEQRLSEVAVPIWVEGKVFGVIDSAYPKRNAHARWHLRMLKEIAGICTSKISLQVMRDRIRDKIARDLHDDMGSSLSSINILSRIALENANGAEQVNAHLKKIRENSANMLETMSDIVWAINSTNDTMDKLILRMKEFATDMLDPLNIGYEIKLEGDFRSVRLDLNIRKDFYLVFKEAVNNAAKYSG